MHLCVYELDVFRVVIARFPCLLSGMLEGRVYVSVSLENGGNVSDHMSFERPRLPQCTS